MKRWTFYDPSTGRLLGSGGTFKDEAMMRANLPEGMAAIEGRHDHECQCVDLETMTVVDFVPEQPSEEHEWDGESKRWALSRAALDSRATRDAIQKLEMSQHRPLRELSIDPNNAKARQRLADLDARIAALREKL